MRTKLFAILLIVSLLLVGCGSKAPDTPAAPAEPVVSENPLEAITLGISPAQLLELLTKAGLQVDMPDYTESPLPEDVPGAPQDGRLYNLSDYSFYYRAAGYDLFFHFSYEEQLTSVACADDKIPTPEGLFVGESLKKAKSIYGNDYVENPEDDTLIQYKIGDSYLNLFYEGDTITSWDLDIYPNINND